MLRAHFCAGFFSVCAMVLRLSQLRMQNVALGFQALAHGRKSKRACCESLGAPCPGHLGIWTRRCKASNLTQHRCARRRDVPLLRCGNRVTQEGSCSTVGMIDVTGMLKANERDKLSASARASRNAVERTWREYHTKAFTLRLPGVSSAPFPLAAHAKKGAAAIMKFDGFRTPRWLN